MALPALRLRLPSPIWFAVLLSLTATPDVGAQVRTFQAGSLIVPMDVQYQNHGMLQAYGLVYRLLQHRIPVYWIVAYDKTLRAECDPDAGCPWDCADPIEGGPCRFLTFSPDFEATATVVWDDAGLRPPGQLLPPHGYRGGPFVIDSADAAAARAVIDAWNDPALWPVAPWAERDLFAVVSVHEAQAPFDAPVPSLSGPLDHPPRPAIAADGEEAMFAAVLRAAGIPMSNGAAFLDVPCDPGACGPGTERPDLLPLELLNPERDSCLGDTPFTALTSLLDRAGLPRYTNLAFAGFTRARREEVSCERSPCALGTIPQCFDSPLIFHGHRLLLHL